MSRKYRLPGGNSLSRRNMQKFLSNRLAILGALMVLALLLTAVFAPLLTPHDPERIDPARAYQSPSAEHPLGTDDSGRDLLARILYGGRLSILIGIASAVGASIVGTILGCLCGYLGGTVDALLIYLAEVSGSFPRNLLIMIIVAFSGRSITNMILIFIFTGWMGTMRIVRGRFVSLREEPFVETCRASGISGASIMFRQILPNTVGPVTVSFTMHTASYVLSEAGLSFLGLGIPVNIPTWGNIVNSARSFTVIINHPVLWLAPGIMISLFVLGVNFFGDGLRDVFDTRQ